VQRSLSVFDKTKQVNSNQYIVTQVDSKLGGTFGHSELFIEEWGDSGIVTTTKIHVQTLRSTRIDILTLHAPVQFTNIRGHKSYVASKQQYDAIMAAAHKIKRKMEKKRIVYAEVFPDNNDKWKTVKKLYGSEMSCKSFTDALLIEAGLRQTYGGLLVNAPWDL